METDDDRLASIKGLGGQLVRTESGEFWAIFDSSYQDALAGGEIESERPALSSCRSSDVQSLQIRKGTSIEITEGAFKVYRVEKLGEPGWSRVLLSS